MVRVAVIGTSGRRDRDRLKSRQQFNWIVTRAIEYLRTLVPSDVAPESAQDWCQRHVVVVSGGAAWADHAAVHLWKQNWCHTLEMHVPFGIAKLPLSARVRILSSEGTNSSRRLWSLTALSSGRGVEATTTSKRLHTAFERATGVPSISELGEVWQASRTMNEPRVCWNMHRGGFHARNTSVAKVDHMLAFVTETNSEQLEGGTRDTWDLCRGVRVRCTIPESNARPPAQSAVVAESVAGASSNDVRDGAADGASTSARVIPRSVYEYCGEQAVLAIKLLADEMEKFASMRQHRTDSRERTIDDDTATNMPAPEVDPVVDEIGMRAVDVDHLFYIMLASMLGFDDYGELRVLLAADVAGFHPGLVYVRNEHVRASFEAIANANIDIIIDYIAASRGEGGKDVDRGQVLRIARECVAVCRQAHQGTGSV